jgi:1,4-dihydroxy-2-naphthoyl-CoA hydrolase
MAIKLGETITIQALNEKYRGNMVGYIGIEYTELGDDFLCAKMPVDHRTMQPFNILHGGASVVLAETIGSVASNLAIDQSTHYCVGLDITANHIKSAKSGYVYGKATALHIGRKTHVWDIKITNESDEIVCVSRLTVAVIPK